MKNLDTGKPKKEKPELSPEEQARRDKLTTRIITIVLAVALIGFVAWQMFSDTGDSNNTPQETPAPEETLSPEEEESLALEEQSEEPVDPFNRTPIETGNGTQDPIFDGGPGTVYRIITPEQERVCEIRIPLGYKANPVNGGVQVVREDIEPTVQGYDPLTFLWTYHGEAEKAVAHGGLDYIADNEIEGYKTYKYEILDRYHTTDLNGNPQEVVVMRSEKEYTDDGGANLGPVIQYYISLRIPSENNLYFLGTVDASSADALVSGSCPDIPSLARAMFPPAEGEPEYDPNGTEAGSKPNEETESVPEETENGAESVPDNVDTENGTESVSDDTNTENETESVPADGE